MSGDDLDELLERLAFESGQYDPEPDSWGTESILCYCGHPWHAGACRAYIYMSVMPQSFNRKAHCACESPKAGPHYSPMVGKVIG